MITNNIESCVLYHLINNVSLHIWWKDLNSIFLGCNENTAKFVGLKHPDEIIGLTDYDIYEDKKDAEFVIKKDQEIINRGKPQLNFEECLTLPELGKRWLSTSKIPLRDKENNIIGTIGWFQDITELKEMQIRIDENNRVLIQNNQALKLTNEKLESANFDLERFTYAASHDLKSPVVTMKSFIGLMKDANEDYKDPNMHQYLTFISNSADRMQSLIEDILDYARTGANQFDIKEMDVSEIISEKLIDIKSSSEFKNPTITLSLPTHKIVAYPKLLGLVFYNIIHNGLKFNNSENPTININYEEEDNYWIFITTDNGNGIHPDYAKDIFQPFKRFSVGSYKGSGLGLSICKRVVSLHGGEIWVEESCPGKTQFKFSISKALKKSNI